MRFTLAVAAAVTYVATCQAAPAKMRMRTRKSTLTAAGFGPPKAVVPVGVKDTPPADAKAGFEAGPTSRIVGGVDAPTFEGSENFKWITNLYMEDESYSYTCGASLITDELLLSAAHCFASDGMTTLHPFTTITAKIGVIDTSAGVSAEHQFETREVICTYLHEEYSPFTFANDIAVLKLASPVSAAYVPVTTAGPNADQSGDDFLVAGWGGTVQDDLSDENLVQQYPNVLQIGATSSITQAECVAVYGESNIGDGNICGAAGTGVDACYGDSGGPLFKNEGGNQVLYGVVSWGLGCAADSYPGVYTWVGQYQQWIADMNVAMSMCTGETSDDDPSNPNTGPNVVSDVGKTQGGCRCFARWGLTDSTCTDGDAVYDYCGMAPACDGDNQGNAQTTSWCLVDTTDGCAPAGANWDYCTIGLGICEENEFAHDGGCHACPPGTVRPAGDVPLDSNGQPVTTYCNAILCAENEHVIDNECVACAAGDTNVAGDSAAGGNTACTSPPGDTGCVPSTWQDDEATTLFTLVGPYRLRYTKDHRVDGGDAIEGKNAEECMRLCIEHGNECRAVEHQWLTGTCFLMKSQTTRTGTTPEKTYWNVYDRNDFCGGPVTTTPEPTTLPNCPQTAVGSFRSIDQKRLKHTWLFSIGERLRATAQTGPITEEDCARICVEVPNFECRAAEYRDGSAAQDGSQGVCELKHKNSAETPPKDNDRWKLLNREIFDCLEV
eukprot:m.80258 g.80258  ORF g.80258 m.80258 type:complete len:723 (-) comp9339_c0_seq1:232-2400(-)